MMGQCLQAKVEEECKKEQQHVQYVSAKWLIGLKSNLSGECDITYQVEPELGQIVKLQLRERIAKQKVSQYINWKLGTTKEAVLKYVGGIEVGATTSDVG